MDTPDQMSAESFALRMKSAMTDHPECPNGHGSGTWLQSQLSQKGLDVSLETVRKWTAGITVPRSSKLSAIAESLRVDAAWLAIGVDTTIDLSTEMRITRLRTALLEIGELTDDPAVIHIVQMAIGKDRA